MFILALLVTLSSISSLNASDKSSKAPDKQESSTIEKSVISPPTIFIYVDDFFKIDKNKMESLKKEIEEEFQKFEGNIKPIRDIARAVKDQLIKIKGNKELKDDFIKDNEKLTENLIKVHEEHTKKFITQGNKELDPMDIYITTLDVYIDTLYAYVDIVEAQQAFLINYIRGIENKESTEVLDRLKKLIIEKKEQIKEAFSRYKGELEVAEKIINAVFLKTRVNVDVNEKVKEEKENACPDKEILYKAVTDILPYFTYKKWKQNYNMINLINGERLMPMGQTRLKGKLWNIYAGDTFGFGTLDSLPSKAKEAIEKRWNFKSYGKTDKYYDLSWFTESLTDFSKTGYCEYKTFIPTGHTIHSGPGSGKKSYDYISLVFEPAQVNPFPYQSSFVRRLYRAKRAYYVRLSGFDPIPQEILESDKEGDKRASYLSNEFKELFARSKKMDKKEKGTMDRFPKPHKLYNTRTYHKAYGPLGKKERSELLKDLESQGVSKDDIEKAFKKQLRSESVTFDKDTDETLAMRLAKAELNKQKRQALESLKEAKKAKTQKPQEKNESSSEEESKMEQVD